MRLSLFALFALGIVLAATGFSATAQAQNYPWCAQYSGDMGGAQNCGFVSFDQCMLNTRGIGGFCMQNNRYVPPPGPAAQSTQRTHKPS